MKNNLVYQARYVFLVSLLYGLWWNFIDSVPRIGETIGQHYQILLTIGHIFPMLLFVLLHPNRWEIGVAGGLFASLIMDSPLWGFYQQYVYHTLPFGLDWVDWGLSYFNPFIDKTWWGLDLIVISVIPVTSLVMFLSVVSRGIVIVLLLLKEFYWDRD